MKFLIFLFVLQLQSQVVLRQLPGQLGNNFYTLSAAISLAKENHCPIQLPPFYSRSDRREYFPYYEGSAAHDFFKIVYHRISQHVTVCQTHTLCKYSDGPTYSPIRYHPGIELDGYFQNENYFKKYINLVRDILSITPKIQNHLESHFSHILNHPKTVGVHIRTAIPQWIENQLDPKFYQTWLAPDVEFYKKAMAMFDDDSLFIVCTDHVGWCKRNLPNNCIIIENQEFIYDFFLLSKCKGLIIAASTFGLWAAYLNENADCKVIYRNPFVLASFDYADRKNWISERWTALDMTGHIPPNPLID